MKKKKRIGKIEKKIIEELEFYTKGYNYIEYSLRLMAKEIKGDYKDDTRYNIVRNAVDRLEQYGIIQTKIVSVYCPNKDYFPKGMPTKLRMIRKWAEDKPWACEKGIFFV